MNRAIVTRPGARPATRSSAPSDRQGRDRHAEHGLDGFQGNPRPCCSQSMLKRVDECFPCTSRTRDRYRNVWQRSARVPSPSSRRSGCRPRRRSLRPRRSCPRCPAERPPGPARRTRGTRSPGRDHKRPLVCGGAHRSRDRRRAAVAQPPAGIGRRTPGPLTAGPRRPEFTVRSAECGPGWGTLAVSSTTMLCAWSRMQVRPSGAERCRAAATW